MAATRRGISSACKFHQSRHDIYYLKNDPTEMRNLADREPEILNRMIHDYQKMADHIGVESEIEFKVGKWYTPVEEYLK